MRVKSGFGLAVLLIPMLLSAESPNAADFPLRFHIFKRSEVTFYRHHYPEESRGEGLGNLFEGGQVHAVDFNFDCEHKLRDSMGGETYPARWKRPGRQLTVLLPVFGEAGKFYTCTLDTDVKPDTAYYSHDGRVAMEPSAAFQAWMVRHNYDPEHGKESIVPESSPSPGAPQAPPQTAAPSPGANPPPPQVPPQVQP